MLTRLRRRDPNTAWLLAVGGAALTSAVVFSMAQGIFHPYYVSLLAPFSAAHWAAVVHSQIVPVVITTHRAREGSVRKALAEIDALATISSPTVCLRIIDQPKEFAGV